MNRERLACLIAGRNLGDIVIASGTLSSLIAADYAERYIVWTRPQMAYLYESFPSCEVVSSPFPVGTRKEFGVRGMGRFIAAAARIRRMRPSVSLDLVGDFRERIFARLIGSDRHVCIGWAHEHPYTNLVRNPFGAGRPLVVVPVSTPNVYSAHELFVRALTGKDAADRPSGAYPSGATKAAGPRKYRVGLHPFASQRCKIWPKDSWLGLAERLLASGCTVVAFSAPSEKPALCEIFARLGDRVEMVAGGLPELIRSVSGLDLMIGLDSFSVHLAHQVGVHSITINAGAPGGLWAIPSGRTLAESGGCTHYPCYNAAPCQGTSYENACINAITDLQVIAAVESFRRKAREHSTDAVS